MIALSKTDIDALNKALDQVYRSFATYNAIIRRFGAVSPLERIREVDATHIAVLQCICTRYALPFPKNRWLGRVGRHTDLARACAGAIREETERVRTYRHLIANVQDDEVRAELRNLERAAHDGHLPALRAWARQLGQRHGQRADADAATDDAAQAHATVKTAGAHDAKGG